MKLTDRIADLTVGELITLIVIVVDWMIVASKSHTVGGLCNWGPYTRHFDYCTEKDCYWLQSRKWTAEKAVKEFNKRKKV